MHLLYVPLAMLLVGVVAFAAFGRSGEKYADQEVRERAVTLMGCSQRLDPASNPTSQSIVTFKRFCKIFQRFKLPVCSTAM